MRVTVMAGQTVTPWYECTLQRLINILLDVVSKNPSNLNFGQLIFGCMCLYEVQISTSPSNVFSDVDCVFKFGVSGITFDV